MEELLVAVGREVPVGTPLARIGAPAGAPVAPRRTPSRRSAAGAASPASTAAPAGRRRRRRWPADDPRPDRSRARRSAFGPPRGPGGAAELGVDLAGSAGSRAGRRGSVARPTRSSAAPAARRPEPAPRRRPRASGTRGRAAAMRHAIAALMARSKREIPHYYLATTVDLRRHGVAARAQRAPPVAERLLPAALLLKATALAARGSRRSTASGSTTLPARRRGAPRRRGLAARRWSRRPGDPRCRPLALDELMARAARPRGAAPGPGRLRSSEMTDPTITVTNLGDQGADEVFGVIYPPQVALVGFGASPSVPGRRRACSASRPRSASTLAADHRASDGHDGAASSHTIDRPAADPGGAMSPDDPSRWQPACCRRRRSRPRPTWTPLDGDASLQAAAELDSMDFLNVVTAPYEETGIDVPERDYPAVASVSGWVS